jgi:transglutaminase-like putative cysteine protease
MEPRPFLPLRGTPGEHSPAIIAAMNDNLEPFLAPAQHVDSSHPAVRAFALDIVSDERDARTKAVKLYYAVRDRFRYDPYAIDLSTEGLKASTVLANGHGWCVTKAALLAAACRAAGVPARVGFADVRNHLSTERLRRMMQTDTFYWHGYTSIELDGRWLKATPAFNIELCRKFALQPLEFDGLSDSIYHPFDLNGNRHMEYLQLRGEFADVPADEINAAMREHYPLLLVQSLPADFAADVDVEIAAQRGA